MKEIATEVAVEIRKSPRVCGGAACIGATRIPVWLIVSLFKQRAADAAILESYPQLRGEHLELARDYYRRHQTEIDGDIQEQDDDLDLHG